jgi:hypothetical protein
VFHPWLKIFVAHLMGAKAMEALWRRLIACEGRLEQYRRMLAGLVRENRILKQQLKELRGQS